MHFCPEIMTKIHKIAFFLLLFCTQSCKINESKSIELGTNIFNMSEPELFLDNNITNPNLEDNLIYLGGRSFIYSYKYTQNGQVKYCYLEPSDSLNPPASILADKPNGKSIKIDEIKLSVYKGKGDISLAKTQTIIKYDYLSENRRLSMGERTGVVENGTSIFLHPPRSHCFLPTGFYSFPNLKLPLSIGATWEAYFSVPSHVKPRIEDTFFPKAKVPEGVDHYYNVEDTLTVKSNFGNLKCFKIVGTGMVDERLFSKTTMLFNEDYGFVELTFFNTADSITLSLTLKKITE